MKSAVYSKRMTHIRKVEKIEGKGERKKEWKEKKGRRPQDEYILFKSLGSSKINAFIKDELN